MPFSGKDSLASITNTEFCLIVVFSSDENAAAMPAKIKKPKKLKTTKAKSVAKKDLKKLFMDR